MTDIPFAFYNSHNNRATTTKKKQNKSAPVTNVNKQALPNC